MPMQPRPVASQQLAQGDILVRPLLNDGRGPVHPTDRTEVLAAHTPRRAVECMAEDMARGQFGSPELDDQGTDLVDYYFTAEDCHGNVSHHRCRVTVRFHVETTPHALPEADQKPIAGSRSPLDVIGQAFAGGGDA